MSERRSNTSGPGDSDRALQALKRRGLLAGGIALFAALFSRGSEKVAEASQTLTGDTIAAGRLLVQPPSVSPDEIQLGIGSTGGGGNTFLQIRRTAAVDGDISLSAFRAGGGQAQLLVEGAVLRARGPFLANDANAVGAAPMVLRQVAGNEGMVITDQNLPNPKDVFFGLDPTFSFVQIQAVQQNVGGLPINLLGGNVGVGTTNPSALLHVAGAAQVDGNLVVLGTKSRGVRTSTHGTVKLYAVEAPENWFEDIGRGRLIAGAARVDLESVFRETVESSTQYHVFVTPLGDCKGLFVSAMDPAGFEVRVLQAGVSDVEFDYRVILKQRGLESTRMETVRTTGLPRSAVLEEQ